MQSNLVIVESPAKAKTIEKFLGSDYKVMSSYGHIRDLKSHSMSVDEATMEPVYEIPDDKQPVVRELRSAAKKAKKVWLASDEDREGEAISWHLCEVLGLDGEATSRIVFHEITKPAILAAIESPRHLDMNLVNAQQARRVLDRIVGFKISPVLWRKVKPQLSAGRVQSVAVRLIVEREREIGAFKSEPSYRVAAIFDAGGASVRATLGAGFHSRGEAMAFLESQRGAIYTIANIAQKPLSRTPAPPFTTSTLQQEAARKLGLPVSRTMSVAQKLYEAGLITYMRTDSVNLSKTCLDACQQEIAKLWGDDYHKRRQYHTSSKGAQEAHEAIRPTYMANHTIEGTAQEQKLYELIWKRTAACQMADARIEKTTAEIAISGQDKLHFTATGEVVRFDGFLKVYLEGRDDEAEAEDSRMLPPLAKGQKLSLQEMTATERYTAAPPRYTEASLVKKMEELGIGRPSTYAPTISTIQQREYVAKGDHEGTERKYDVLTLAADGNIAAEVRKEMAGSDKGKLLPTDVGTVVNDYLVEHFPGIFDYNFTARVEQQFDDIAEGGEQWKDMMREFYKDFDPQVEQALEARNEHKAGERLLGTDPKSGRPVFAKIGRFGPMVQIGTADEQDKPLFAQLPAGKSLMTVELNEALEMFKLPRDIGQYEGKTVTIGAGRFGPYARHDGLFASLPKGADPLTITLDEAIELLQAKRKANAERHIMTLTDKDGVAIEVLKGRFGPYIARDGKNYKIPKAQQEAAAKLTLEECEQIIASQPEKPAKAKATRKKAKKA